MPKSVPLRAIATTRSSRARRGAASRASLQAGITRLRKKWSLPLQNRTTSATSRRRRARASISVGHQLADQHQGAGPVAVVALVAHLQHLGDDRADVDRPRALDAAAHGLLQQRPEHGGHPAQPVDHLGPVGAVPQHLAQPLVERAERACRRAPGRAARTPTWTARRPRPSARPRRGGGRAPARSPSPAASSGAPPPRGRRRGPRTSSRRSARRAAARTRGPSRSAGRRAGTARLAGPAPRGAGRRRPARRRRRASGRARRRSPSARRGSASTAPSVAPAVPAPAAGASPRGAPDRLRAQRVGEQVDARR